KTCASPNCGGRDAANIVASAKSTLPFRISHLPNDSAVAIGPITADRLQFPFEAMAQSLICRKLSCASVLCVVTLAMSPHVQSQTATDTSPARVIVKFRADSSLMRAQILSATEASVSRAQSLGQRLGLSMSGGAAVSERTQVVYASGLSSEELAARLS